MRAEAKMTQRLNGNIFISIFSMSPIYYPYGVIFLIAYEEINTEKHQEQKQKQTAGSPAHILWSPEPASILCSCLEKK